jgi:TrpR-related protein YerC/YecD
MVAETQGLRDRQALSLLRALLSLRSVREAQRFLRDLLTEDEIRMIVDRWRVARLLHRGWSYRRIEAETGLSSRTIARISRWLQRGAGGYGVLLERADERGGPVHPHPAHPHRHHRN